MELTTDDKPLKTIGLLLMACGAVVFAIQMIWFLRSGVWTPLSITSGQRWLGKFEQRG